MPRVFLAILVSAVCAACAAPAGAAAGSAATLQAAKTAYFQMQVADAERGFKAVLGDPAAAPLDVAGAARGLARIQWLIDADAPAAEATLRRGLAAGADLCPTTVYFVRVLREAGDPHAGADLAVQRAGDCPGVAFGDQLLIGRGKAELAWAAADPASRAAALARARTTLRAISRTGQLIPDAARFKLGLALMSGDGAAALDAWRGFFWLTDHNAPESFHIADAAVASLFRSALGPKPKLADEIGLERLLIRGGFFEEARQFDADRGLARRAAADPAYRPVAAYLAFRRRFDPATLAFNRGYARGDHKGGVAYLAEASRLLADAAAAEGDGRDAQASLQKAFGLHWMMGDTGGVASVHLGHVVEDRLYKVEQFGRRGDLRFVSIDNLVSNGYQSWLWDGQAATGGWSEGATIVQVRASYTPGVLQTLAAFDPEVAKKDAAELAQFELRDAEALKAKPVVFLPALQRRLRDEARAQLAAKARAEAARTHAPFERTFLKVAWDAEVGHSIYIHEGRHALDHAEFKGAASLSSPELEFRAKLSELELAEFPRMPLGVILSPDVGGDTSHGIADTRIMQGLVNWIAAHKAEVAGYDPQVPAAEQIDRLSDAQLRAIAHDMDPQFKGR